MSKIQGIRVLVKQFLSAAADEIVEAVEKMISGYEEEMFQSKREIGRQRKMLDALLQPAIRLTITSGRLKYAMYLIDVLIKPQIKKSIAINLKGKCTKCGVCARGKRSERERSPAL